MDKIYCAFLRGVNVKGTNMKMSEVISVFENSGMRNTASVLASGNIVFFSDLQKDILRKKLEKAMSEYFSYDAFLFIKSAEKIQQMLDSNPFIPDENSHIYVFITENGFEVELLNRFTTVKKSVNEKAKIVNNIFYWQVSKGSTLDGEFSKILGQKSLKNKFTSRNINTIEKVWKKMNV
ncbi:conserved hypothetical protein [uncultured Paludibacter sp.]|nr:conserved hypothetical protein [uncultured Paludibacter sp.]